MLIRKKLQNGETAYYDKFTGKRKKLKRGEPTMGHRLPDFVFRYLTPGKTAMNTGGSDDQMMTADLSILTKRERGTNMMAKKKRTVKKS